MVPSKGNGAKKLSHYLYGDGDLERQRGTGCTKAFPLKISQ